MGELTPETVSNLHGVLRIGLEARNAPKEVVEAADKLFFELARRAGFPFLRFANEADARPGNCSCRIGYSCPRHQPSSPEVDKGGT